MWRTYQPQNPKMCDAILETPLKMQSYYSQSRRENATPSSGRSPVASYKEVTSQCSVYGNDFGVLQILCEDGECYSSWHVFVTQLCNKPFRFSSILLILCIVSFYFPDLIHPADVFRQVTFTKVNQNLTEQSPPLAPTVPPREQNGSTSGWLCRTPHLPEKWRSTWKEHWWRHSTRAIQSENVVVSWLPMVTTMWCITRTLSVCKAVSVSSI